MFSSGGTPPNTTKRAKKPILEFLTWWNATPGHPEERPCEMVPVFRHLKSTWAAWWMSLLVLSIRLHFKICILKIFWTRKNHKSPVAAQPWLLMYPFHLPTLQDRGLFHELLIVLQTSSCPFVCHPQKKRKENQTNGTGVPPMFESDVCPLYCFVCCTALQWVTVFSNIPES